PTELHAATRGSTARSPADRRRASAIDKRSYQMIQVARQNRSPCGQSPRFPVILARFECLAMRACNAGSMQSSIFCKEDANLVGGRFQRPRQPSSAGQSGVVSWNCVFFGNPPIDLWLAPSALRLIDHREGLAAEETAMRGKR